MLDKTLAPGKRDIIVCALDLTLADHAGNPHRTNIQLMSDLVEAYSSRQLVIVSDKVDGLRDDVVMWLNTHVDYYHLIVMRPPGVYLPAADLMRQRLSSAGSPNSKMPLPSAVLCAFDARPEVRAVWGEFHIPCYLTPAGEGW
jgi:hypothetical protein